MSLLHDHDRESEPRSGAGKSILAALIVLLCLGGAVYWFYGRAPAPAPAPVEEAPPPVAEEEESIPIPPKVEETPSTGGLSVRADVEGAVVYVNGTEVGPAPYEDASIRVGSHEVKVTKEGYEDYVEIVRVGGGRTAEVRASLDVLGPSLRITSDVPGATVFLDRNYIGTTPVDIEAVEPGEHELTVSADGYDMYAETVTVTTGHHDIQVSFEQQAAQLNESVRVIHKHTFGDCQGTLIADTSGIRYETDHKDAFSIPFAALERFEIDYIDKNLNLRIRDGKNYNFTELSGDADALFLFHRNVQEFMERT